MVKNVEIIIRKERYDIEGVQGDTLKIIQKMDNAVVNLVPAKTSKDLLKYIIGFDTMEYDKDYLLYKSVIKQ